MKEIKIIIEKTDDLYTAYAADVPGIYGGGETVLEARKSIEDAIRLLKEYNTEDNIPNELKGDYKLVFKYDVVSLLNYFKRIIPNSALERMTGINQKQLQHYASGLKKPRQPQVKKIENALHEFGKELMSVQLS